MKILKNLFLVSFVLFSLTVILSGCEKKSKPILNLAIWGNYLSPELEKQFTESTGIKIRMTNYSSNEELLAKVQTGGASFDVAVPSDYMVSVMSQLGLLETLDKSQLPNFANLDPQFLAQDFDPQNNHSIPYGWTTAGIAVRKDLYKESITSWKDLFENPKLKGQISVLDDMRELSAAILKLQNASVNTTELPEIQEAFKYLKKVKAQVKVFTVNAVDLLKNKEIKAGFVYSSDALLAQKTDPNIDYVIPKEGATRAIDNLVIIKNAANKKEAHAFLNFMMTKEANLSSVMNIRVGPVVKGVKELLPEDLQKNKALFPAPEVLTKLERIRDLGEKNSLYENEWTQFKSE